MRRTTATGLLLALVLGTAATTAAAGPVPVPVQSPTVQVAPDAAWCWFSEPRAVHSRGTTYLGWISSRGDITIGAHEEATGAMRSTVVMTGFEVDDHDHPAVLLRPDGRLQAFWSAHNGAELYTRTTVKPHDIDAWGPLGTVPIKVAGDRVTTYANPVVLPGERNRLFVFGRSGYTHPSFTTSGDMGRTWATARALVEVPDQRPYVKYAGDGKATIGMAFTNGHPAEAHTSIYYAAYRGGALRRASGLGIAPMSATPITPAQADLVYSPPAGRDAWVHDVALDSKGRPRVVFATMPQNKPSDHDYWYAAWDGKRWDARRITAAGGSISDNGREPAYTAGISLDHSDPSTVVLARPGLAKLEIERWRTPDAGRTWSTMPVTVASTQDNVRPVVPRGGSGRVLWMTGEYGYFTTFRTAAASDSPVLSPPPAPSSVAATSARAKDSSLRVVGSLSAVGVLAAANKELTLQWRPRGWQRWTAVGTARTDSRGEVALHVPAAKGREYRWVWPGDHSVARSESPLVTT